MKHAFSLLAILLTLCANLCAQTSTHTKKVSSLGNYYWEYLPPGYNPNPVKKYPVMIFLHGCGEIAFWNDYCGNRSQYQSTNLDELNSILKHGPPKEIKNGREMCFTINGVQECFIVISPQLNNGFFSTSWDPRKIDTFIEYVKATYPVDAYRVYLTGLSLGGIGTWDYAVRHPDKLAAILPISGDAEDKMICNLSKIPIWTFHDQPDPVLSTQKTLDAEKALNACSVPGKLTPRVTLIRTYENGVLVGKHSIWNTAYGSNPSPDSSSTNTRGITERPDEPPVGETVYSWLLKKSRTLLGPIVDVEADKKVAGSSASITSTVTHPEASSTITSYLWEYLPSSTSPPAPTMSSVNTSTLSVSNMTNGAYRFRLTVKDNQGFMDTDEIVVTPKTLPGKIEAERYDARSGVSTETTTDTGGGSNLTSIDANDWMDYTLGVETTGTYNLSFRVAKSTSGSANFEIRKGASTLQTVTVPSTGGVQTWTTVTVPVNLVAGAQTLRLFAVQGGWKLNWIEGSIPVAPVTFPAKIEAENYTLMQGVQTGTTTDVGGGLNVGYIDAGDWMEYLLDVQNTGVYNMAFRVASNASGTGSFEIRSGGNLLGTLNVPGTSGWQNWVTINTNIPLSVGVQTLRIQAVTSGWNINWFEGLLSNYTLLPATIQAENYQAMSGIQTQNTTDAGGGQNLSYIDANDWMDYNVYVPATGTYNVSYRLAGKAAAGKIELRQGGIPIDTIPVPNTTGWQTWTTVTRPVTLTSGAHTLRLYVLAGGWNINWFSVANGSSARVAEEEKSIAEKAFTYPNPGSSDIHVVFNSLNKKSATIKIYNHYGVVLYQQVSAVADGKQDLKLNNLSLPSGDYIVEITQEGKMVSRQKLIIVK